MAERPTEPDWSLESWGQTIELPDEAEQPPEHQLRSRNGSWWAVAAVGAALSLGVVTLLPGEGAAEPQHAETSAVDTDEAHASPSPSPSPSLAAPPAEKLEASGTPVLARATRPGKTAAPAVDTARAEGSTDSRELQVSSGSAPASAAKRHEKPKRKRRSKRGQRRGSKAGLEGPSALPETSAAPAAAPALDALPSVSDEDLGGATEVEREPAPADEAGAEATANPDATPREDTVEPPADARAEVQPQGDEAAPVWSSTDDQAPADAPVWDGGVP